MINANFGYLLKKEKIKIKDIEYIIWELIDYVCGLSFENSNEEYVFYVCSGEYSYDCIQINNLKEKYTVFIEDIDKIVKENDNRVNLKNIREKKLKQKYYYQNVENSKDTLIPIIDKEYVNAIDEYLEKQNKVSKFNESFFEKESDIYEMYETIKKTIIAQDEQIMQILTAIYKNQKVIDSDLDIDTISKLKENILICGPTGTGKTEILKRISSIYQVPIVIEDATSLSETGYAGREITDMLYDLYLAADENIDKAEKGILVIDEFDKLAENRNNESSHVSRIGVQRSLLKLLDGSTYYLNKRKSDINSSSTKIKIPFNTTKLTIVCLGAFSEIQKFSKNQSIGFNSDLNNKQTTINYKNITMEQFVNYGIMQELMGRFSKIISMNSLSKDNIKEIFVNSNFSPIVIYKKLFDTMNIEFIYDDAFVEWIAEKAILLKSGARSLKTIFDECISSALFRIFAGEYSKIEMIKPSEENGKSYILTKCSLNK